MAGINCVDATVLYGGTTVLDRSLLRDVRPVAGLRAADFDDRIGPLMAELGIHDPEQPADRLSGGQLGRLALASVLLAQPEILLLDEPTNDLDTDGLQRLEKYVTESPAGIGWSATTARSSPPPSTGSSSWTSSPAPRRSTTAAGTAMSPNGPRAGPRRSARRRTMPTSTGG